MTFVCAQAFDMNYRKWQANREQAKKDAIVSESTDVEPSQAWQKKKSEEEKASEAAAGTIRYSIDIDSVFLSYFLQARCCMYDKTLNEQFPYCLQLLMYDETFN